MMTQLSSKTMTTCSDLTNYREYEYDIYSIYIWVKKTKEYILVSDPGVAVCCCLKERKCVLCTRACV